MVGGTKGPYGPKPITRFRSDGQVGSAGSIFEMKAAGSALIFSMRSLLASPKLDGASNMPLNCKLYFQSIA